MINSKRAVQSKAWGLGWADVLLLLTVIFWGVNMAVVKFAVAEIPPLALNGVRFVVASGTMLLLAWGTGHSLRFQRKHIAYLVGIGLLGNSIYQLFFILGIARTTADNSALILATVPAWVGLFGTIAGVERVQFQGWMGVLLSLIGVAFIIAGSDRQADFAFGGATLAGDVLILIGTVCWSCYTLLVRPLMRHYSPASVTSASTAIGTIPLVLLAIPSLAQLDYGDVSTTAWLAVVASGVFGIALAYFFWNNGISHLGSARTSLYSNLTPPITLLTAWILLGETLTLQQWGGALLALLGVVLARRFTHPVDK